MTGIDESVSAPVTALPAVPHRRAWPYVRLLAALIVTPSLLIYQWGLFLVTGMFDGRPHFRSLAILGAGIALVILLTVRLSPRLAFSRIEPHVVRLVAAIWIVVTALIIWLFSGDLIPRLFLVALFVPSTFWVVWLAWMFYRPWRWSRRLGGLAFCLALIAPFPWLLTTAGLTGDARVNFAWRSAHGETPPKPAAGSAAAPANEPAVSPAKDTGTHDFPQFLGPDRTGVISGAKLSPDWQGRPPRELWRHAVGEGWSSFAIVGDRAVTQEQRGDDECIICCRVSDGGLVWARTYPARFGSNAGESTMGGLGPRATPTIADGHVYAIGATGKLHCLDAATGQVTWVTDVQKDNDGHGIAHGVCASPLVVGDHVIVAPTGNAKASLAAYDRTTGKKVWSAGKFPASYGSPALVELAGRRQIVLFTDDGVEGHDPETGEFLWNFHWTNHVRVNCSQPLVIDGPAGRLLIATGYDNGSTLIELAAGEKDWSIQEIWKSPRELKTKFTTAVRLGNFVYGLDDGILACLDLATGKRQWKGGRYQHGQILLAGALLLVQAENGEVVLVRPDPKELIELGRIPALTGKTWNNPALAGRFLFVRNDHEAACFELPVAE
jgi:outer membrane protein assembly factor BamB